MFYSVLESVQVRCDSQSACGENLLLTKGSVLFCVIDSSRGKVIITGSNGSNTLACTQKAGTRLELTLLAFLICIFPRHG